MNVEGGGESSSSASTTTTRPRVASERMSYFSKLLDSIDTALDQLSNTVNDNGDDDEIDYEDNVILGDPVPSPTIHLR